MRQVDVIVPVYNVEKYLKRCLESLINQTLSSEKYRVLLVDDGSTDGSSTICQKYADENPNLVEYLPKANGGLSDARNYGLQHVDASYVLFIDSDDYVESGMLERMLEKTCNGQKKVVECNFFWQYQDRMAKDVVTGYDSIEDYLVKGRVVAWNKLYRTDWLKQCGITFPKGLFYEDQCFFFELMPFLESIDEVAVDEVCEVHYVQRNDSISYQNTSRLADLFKIYVRILNFHEENGWIKTYHDELEYRFVRNLLGNVMLRKIRPIKDGKVKRDLVVKVMEFIDIHFKGWKKNKYIKWDSPQNIYLKIFNKLILKMLIN